MIAYYIAGFFGGIAGGIVVLLLGVHYYRARLVAELDRRRLHVLGPNSTRADALELL